MRRNTKYFLVTSLVLVRMSLWNFKEGKREEAFLELDHILNTETRNSNGFRGYISLLSHENPNVVTILTLWQDEESLKASEKAVFAHAKEKVKDALKGSAKIENYQIFSAVFPAEGEVKGIDKSGAPKFVFLKK
jgi:quinol monooxygenase YgiN